MGDFGRHDRQGRVEDARFLSGAGRYVDDIRLAEMLHLIVVRSPHGHAVITSIDVTEAMSMPGVHAVLTGADLAADGIGTIPCVSKPAAGGFLDPVDRRAAASRAGA